MTLSSEQPCPYPDCKGNYGHSSPHLIEAAAIDKRIKKETTKLREAIKNFTDSICGDDELPHEESERTFHILKGLIDE